jgi:hypothetical protein
VKKTVIMVIFLTICLNLFAPGAPSLFIEREKPLSPVCEVWFAVKMVESYGIESIINHKEGAYGCGQIRQVKLNEYNKATGEHITLQDCLSEKVSKKIFLWHCSRYSDLELAVKRWNGSGPATVKYWNKVKKYL